MSNLDQKPRHSELKTQNSKLRWLLGIALVLLLAGAGVAAWAAQSGWSADAPHVLGISPPPGSRDVSGDTPISIAFNMPMNSDSVRSALSIDPPTGGTTSWDGNTLVFHPQPGYRRGVTYTVQIGTGASSPLFRNLSAPASTSFKTAGLPSLYRSVPPMDAAGVPTDTMVTLQFSRPMAALSALDSAKDPGGNVRIQPDPGGRWQWLGSTTLAYRASGLRPATSYSVSVSHELSDFTGGTLDRDYSFSFTTVRPRVAATVPETNTEFVGTRDPIVVTFNTPVDHASAEAGFRLSPSAPGSFTWSPNGTVFTYTLTAPLAADTAIQARIADLKPATGDLPMEKPYTWIFHTTPHAKVLETTPQDGTNAVQVPTNELIVRYSAPISNSTDEIRAGVSIDPPVKGMSAYSYDQGATLNIFAPLAPSISYTVTVGGGQGYKDRDGAGVPAYTWHFRTARTKPDAHVLNSNGLVSYYGGLPTRVFLSAVNVDQFVRLRLWKLGGAQFGGYLSTPLEDRAKFQPSGDPVRTWDIPVTYQLDKLQTLNPVVALDAQADRLLPGFYYLRVTSPQTGNSPGTINSTALIVGNAGLIMKQSQQEILLWAVGMGTGKLLSGRTIRVFSGNQTVGSVTTDGDGLARLGLDMFKYNSQPTAILDDGADAAVVSSAWDDQIGPWNFDLNIKDRKPNTGQAIYTERAIYRPGQVVYFKGIIRNDDDGRYSIPSAPVAVTLNDNNGQTIYSATLKLSPFGSFAGQYTLPDAAPLGSYFLSCKCDARGEATGTTFQVQEYRKPEYLVNVSTDKQSYSNGEKIATTAGADYFFGGGVADAKMTVRELTQDYFFSWTDPAGGRYDFQDSEPIQDRQASFQGEKRSETTLTTGANGKAALELPADVSQYPMSQLLTIEASVQDSSNQTVSNNTQVVVHKAQWYAGLRPTDYLGTVGSLVAVDVQTVSDVGQVFPNAPLTVKFYRRVWEQTTEKDELGLDRPTWKPHDTQVGVATLTTDAQGKGQPRFTPSEAGEYRITAEGRDSLGNPVASATYAYISDPTPGAGPVPWRQINQSIVTLVADKPSYKPGDTAHILVTSPFSQATGLLTIERGHILSHKIVDLRGPAPIIDLPIDGSYLPNAYLSLSMVAPAASTKAMPGFRQGYVAIPVSAAQKQLTVAITPSSTAAHPGDTITYTLKVSDAAGAPAHAELSLALVDKAIFSLADDTTPSLMDSFYGIRPLDFTTASSLLILADQVATARTNGAKGGGGGGGNGLVRSNFSDTAFWRAQVTTEADGQAVVSVRLPDNLTTWRLTTLAVTAGTLVGQATNEIVSSKPLLIRPRLPRFMVAGDRVEPAAIIENRSGCDADADVTLVISGSTFVKDSPAATQHVHLTAETIVSWSLTASQVPTATFSFNVGAVSCKGANVPGDAVEVALPVKPPLTTEDVVTSGDVQGDGTATERVFLYHGVDTTKGQLTLDVAPSLAAGAAKAVDYVKDDQYDSTEESISRFLPLLQLDHAYSISRLKTPYSAEVPGIVNRSIVRLYTDQHFDGGWGWFIESPTDPYITAYALDGLIAARTAGYIVSEQVLTNASKYLQSWLNSAPQDARSADLRLDTRAYVLFVIAENGQDDLSSLRALAVRGPSLSLYGRAYLVLAFQRLGAAADADRLLTDLTGAAKQTTTTAHWEEPSKNTPEYFLDMDTDARTTALVVRALLAHDKNDPLVEHGVRWLMESRRTGHWLSTQETATVLETLAAYMLASGELNGRSDWSATINKAPWGASSNASGPPTETTVLRRAVNDLLINQDNVISLVRQGTGGRLYYSLNLSYARAGEGATARNEGLSIIREYLKPSTGASSPGTPVQSLAAGDLVEIHLTLIAPADSYYVVAEDPLPAGLEAVNGTLQTTGLTERLNPPNPYGFPGGGDNHGEGGKPGGPNSQNPDFVGSGFFDHVDMRDDRTLLYATFLPAGVYEYRYLARATTRGAYTALPATARLTYLPDVWGRSDSAAFTVTGGK